MRIIKKELIQMTPDMAEALLKKNFLNIISKHFISNNKVQMIKEWIELGLWRAEKKYHIEILPNGNLLNGQHRLTAISQSGKAVPLWVYTVTF